MKDQKRFVNADKKAKEIALEQDIVVPKFDGSYQMPVIKATYPKLHADLDEVSEDFPTVWDTEPNLD